MDSKRWAKDLPADVRDVLDAGASLSAPDGAKQAVWSALSTKLPAATVTAAAAGVSVLSVLKPLAVGLALGAVVTVGVLEIRSKPASQPRSSVRVSASAAPVIAPSSRLRPRELAPNPTNEPALASASAPAIKTAPPTALLGSSLAESPSVSGAPSVAAFPDEAAPQEDKTVRESRRLNQARAALQAGEARAALVQLDALAIEFPSGVLVQEREALRIEALLGLGERQRARELARRFLERYPHSPHAAAVERALH